MIIYGISIILSFVLKFNVNINNEILVPVFINVNVANSKLKQTVRLSPGLETILIFSNCLLSFLSERS